MGIAVNTPTRVMDILAYEPFHVDRDSLVGEALRRRAEYRQAKYQLDAAEAIVRQNFRNFFPATSGTRPERDTADGGPRASEFTEINTAIGVGELNWSIFDGGNKVARYKEAKAVLDATKAEGPGHRADHLAARSSRPTST